MEGNCTAVQLDFCAVKTDPATVSKLSERTRFSWTGMEGRSLFFP